MARPKYKAPDIHLIPHVMEDRKYGQYTCFDQFILLFKYSTDSCCPQNNKLIKIKFRIPKSGPRLPFQNFYP